MLETCGLHELTWDACDERFGDMLVASPADAGGRGISLAVRDGGAAADMTGAALYLAWKHKATSARGTEPFQVVDVNYVGGAIEGGSSGDPTPGGSSGGDLPMPRFRVAIMRNGRKEWLPWMLPLNPGNIQSGRVLSDWPMVNLYPALQPRYMMNSRHWDDSS